MSPPKSYVTSDKLLKYHQKRKKYIYCIKFKINLYILTFLEAHYLNYLRIFINL